MPVPQWQPGNRPAAPAPLDLVQAFINTRAITKENRYAHEGLSSPAALEAFWLAHAPVSHPLQATRDDLELALVVREGLRGLLARNNGATLDEDLAAIERLDAVAGRLPLRVSVRDEDELIAPAGPDAVSNALAGLLTVMVRARVNGTWTRLKACRDPHCRWAFYDTSKNHSGNWCAMSLCGARAKQRTFAARRRQRNQ